MEHDKTTATLGRPRSFDIDEALERAMQVFWQKGYLGTSLSSLTDAMGINRPSLYAAFGNKESLFRQALDRYFKGPSAYFNAALEEPTARAAVERLFQGFLEMLADPKTPAICLWVYGALSCGDHPLREEFAVQRAAGHARLSGRFKRAIAEGDLPADADPAALASFVQVVHFGLSVQAATGASRHELQQVVLTALQSWPK